MNAKSPSVIGQGLEAIEATVEAAEFAARHAESACDRAQAALQHALTASRRARDAMTLLQVWAVKNPPALLQLGKALAVTELSVRAAEKVCGEANDAYQAALTAAREARELRTLVAEGWRRKWRGSSHGY